MTEDVDDKIIELENDIKLLKEQIKKLEETQRIALKMLKGQRMPDEYY